MGNDCCKGTTFASSTDELSTPIDDRSPIADSTPKVEKELSPETVASGEPLVKRSRPPPVLVEDMDEDRVPVFVRVECPAKTALEDFYELCNFQKNDRPVWTDGQNYIYCTSNLQWAVAMDSGGMDANRGWLYDHNGGADKKYPNSVKSWLLYDGKNWDKTQAKVLVVPAPHINVQCKEKEEVNGCYTLMDPKADVPMWMNGPKRLYLNEATKFWVICLQAVTVQMGGGVVRSGADEALMTNEQVTEWPNMVYDWDYHDGEGWTKSKTRLTATKRPPPLRLLVECPEKPELDGTYKQKREKINGSFCWIMGENFIYQTRNGAWAVCIGEECTEKDQGWMYAKNRESKFPDKVTKWDCYNGKEWKASEASITIPERDKLHPPPMPIYKPAVEEEVEKVIETRKKGDEDDEEEDKTLSPTFKRISNTSSTPQELLEQAMRPEAPSRMGAGAESEMGVGILPNTAWNEIKPERSAIAELRENSGIRACVPKIDSIAEDCENKVKELKFVKLPVKLSDDHLTALVAYTHDVMNAGKKPQGNIYFEMNRALRTRNVAARTAAMRDWGPFASYLIMALGKLPDFAGVCYRGYPNKSEAIKEYELGRPIQWGAFASVTTNFEAAKAFTNRKTGVIFKIAVTSGRQIHKYSFFPDESEVLLTPSHRFTVGSEPYQEDGYTCIYLIQQKKSAFVS
mmetsp:Transcript_105268/g.185976  ORF Transcript_105268/g.185976 Transcript_105268/m.185976 type:complete len:686 (+) Transcript_105268:53-2110(+)